MDPGRCYFCLRFDCSCSGSGSAVLSEDRGARAGEEEVDEWLFWATAGPSRREKGKGCYSYMSEFVSSVPYLLTVKLNDLDWSLIVYFLKFKKNAKNSNK